MREMEGDPVTEAEILQAAEQVEGAPEESGVATVTLAEFEQVKQERDQLLDRMARMQAEFDNARKRDAKERSEFREFAVGSSVEQILPVLDNFQLAMKAQGSPEQFRAGVELILRQMEEAMKQLGVQTVETVGTQFDPRFHEALGSIETTEYPDHQVLEEVRAGYRIKERLLRPALVRIAVNHAQTEA
jgi:molecular chaperone GrpE